MSDAFWTALAPTITAAGALVVSIINNIKINHNDRKTDEITKKVEVVHTTINSNHEKEMAAAERMGALTAREEMAIENKVNIEIQKRISHQEGKDEQIQIQKEADKKNNP